MAVRKTYELWCDHPSGCGYWDAQAQTTVTAARKAAKKRGWTRVLTEDGYKDFCPAHAWRK